MSETEGYSWPVAEGAGRGYKTKKATGYVGEVRTTSSVPRSSRLQLRLRSMRCVALGRFSVTHASVCMEIEALGATTAKDRLPGPLLASSLTCEQIMCFC